MYAVADLISKFNASFSAEQSSSVDASSAALGTGGPSDKRNHSQLSEDSQSEHTTLFKLPRVASSPSPTSSADLIPGSFTSLLDIPRTLSPSEESSTSSEVFSSLHSVLSKFQNNIISRLDSFDSKLDERFARFESKFIDLEVRVAAVEESGSSRQLALDNVDDRLGTVETQYESLSQRIVALEGRQDTVSTPTSVSNWTPSAPIETKILLLGDSNSADKLKFGEGKGKLGGALPGSGTFCAHLANLPSHDSDAFTNVTDIIVAVGTNDLKVETSNPEVLANNMYSYVKSVTARNPSAHVHLTGVLPTSHVNPGTNTRIRTYNHFISDMARSLPRVSFIDVKVFLSKEGTLRTRLAEGPSDPLHLNGEGIRLYCSRLKYALRTRLGLPTFQPGRRGVAPRQEEEAPLNRENSRGRGRDRGGRRGR